MAEKSASKRKKGTLGGLLMIVFGVLSAFVVYYNDRHSFDYIRMTEAMNYAIVHAVLWTIAGLCVILWYNRPPPEKDLPFDNRDDNRDGLR